MSDAEVATRAPESDAVDTTLPQNTSDTTTRNQQKSSESMSEHCTSDRPTPSDQQSSGEMTKLSDVETYVSKPADYPNAPGKFLLLLTGGTGVHSINNQLQADLFAKEGYVVVMPDQFSGDPAPNAATVEDSEAGQTLIDQIKMGIANTAKSFTIDMWLARHTQEKVLPIILKVLDAARDEYADAIAHGGGIYAAGYCFGAKYVIILAGEHVDSASNEEAQEDEEQGMVHAKPLIKAGAIAHATLVTKDDLSAVRAPLSMVCVENDPLFPSEVLEHGKEVLASAGVKHEIKTYPGVPHGFAVVGDYNSATIKESQSAALDQMLSWLSSH